METLLEKSLNKHDFPEKERQALAKEGEAMKDGSFSIRNGQDLKDAIPQCRQGKRPCCCEALD